MFANYLTKVNKMEIQGKAPLTVKALVALLATSALYWQDLTLIANEAVK